MGRGDPGAARPRGAARPAPVPGGVPSAARARGVVRYPGGGRARRHAVQRCGAALVVRHRTARHGGCTLSRRHLRSVGGTVGPGDGRRVRDRRSRHGRPGDGPGPARRERSGHGGGAVGRHPSHHRARGRGPGPTRGGGIRATGPLRPRRRGDEQWCARRLLARIHGYHPGPVAARDRARDPAGPHALPPAPGSTWPPGPGTRARPACWPRWTSSRASRPRWGSGRGPSWTPGSSTTGPTGSTPCVCPGRWSGADWRRAAATAPASAGRRRRVAGHTGHRGAAGRSGLALLRAARGDAAVPAPEHGAGRDVLDALRGHGALFHAEVQARTGRLPAEVDEGLWDLVSRGIATADGFQYGPGAALRARPPSQPSPCGAPYPCRSTPARSRRARRAGPLVVAAGAGGHR